MEDAALIDSLGGPTRVAELLGYSKAQGGVQRVSNWRTRGIPPRVKLAHPDIFLVPRVAAASDEEREAAGRAAQDARLAAECAEGAMRRMNPGFKGTVLITGGKDAA